MAEPIPERGVAARYDPDRVGAASFDTVRRGFNESQVRRFLNDIAGSLRNAYRREDELLRRIDAMEQVRADSPPEPDGAELSQMVGDEVTQIIEAARLAAEERKTRAQSTADRILTDARSHATELTEEAEELHAIREAEAREIAEEIQNEAQQVLDRAFSEADQIVENAREQGRTIIGEAQAHRHQMLESMAERRKKARAQVEQLRAGRDALLGSFATVQETLDQATGELETSLSAAKSAADAAVRRVESEPEPSVDELEAEVETARIAGLLTPEMVAAEEVTLPEPEPEPEPEETGPEEPVLEEDAAPEETVPEGEAAAEEPVLEEDAAPEEAVSEEETVTEEEAVSEEPVLEEGSAPEDEAVNEPPVLELVGSDEPEVDDLFARLKAEREQAVEVAEETLEAPAPAPAAAAVVAAPLSVDECEAHLVTRDDAISDHVTAIDRKLKRILADEQNTVLAALAATGTAELPVASAQRLYVGDALTSSLEAAWHAGVDVADIGEPPAPFDVGSLGDLIDSSLIAPLRTLFETRVHGDDTEQITEATRSVYREIKKERLAKVGRDLAAAAFARGVYDACPEGTMLRWVPDETEAPCPDAQDNALAGLVARGERFPTGACFPPAHPGCRCLLIPDRH